MSDFQTRLQDTLGSAYRIERELGGGGMSRLFLAHEATLHRQVVVKVLPPELASDMSVARFKQEIELAAQLQHPHIVPVLGAASGNDLLYYILPYLPDESLRHRLDREGRLPVAAAMVILNDIADALAYAHARGVIHRDLKPENILLAADHAVLTDFGVARALAEARSGGQMTTSGFIVGTPGYMSPEQAAGERRIDERADIYALGVSGYEMLAGAPPFEGATAAALLAAHLTRTPKPLHEVRPEVPRHVSAAIQRALAKEPAQRFQNASELRRALSPDRSRRASPGIRPARWITALLGLAVAVTAGSTAYSLLHGRKAARLDANLIAIAPFNVLDPQLQLWREGMVDLLARNLDGAGPLRTVPPTLSIRRFHGRADPLSAQALGNTSGARLAVFGTLVRSGQDSVRITASIIDVASRGSLGEVELRGATDRLDALVDSVTLGLLRELGRTHAIGAARLASLGSRSLPALKLFLQGEQFFRRAVWDSALVYEERAIASDSNFTLALRRAGLSIQWARTNMDSVGRAYLARAGALNHGLAPRDSVLVAADSVASSIWSLRGDLPWWRDVRRLLTTLENATARYPDDPQIWYELADARGHWAYVPGAQLPLSEIVRTFDRAIALDSAFAPAYYDAIPLTLDIGDSVAARRDMSRYLALSPTAVQGPGLRLAAELLDAPKQAPDAVTRVLANASEAALYDGAAVLGRWPDSAEVAVQIMQERIRRGLPVSPAWHLLRGHLREAAELLRNRRRSLREEGIQLAMLGGSTEAAVRTARDWIAGPTPSYSLALAWWAMAHDTASLRAAVGRADSTVKAATSSWAGDIARYTAVSARAWLALARSDTAEAVRVFDTVPDTMCAWCYMMDAWPRARLLAAAGRLQDAAALLEVQPAEWMNPIDIARVLDRARVHERLGNRARARSEYTFVANAWRNADPELQPLVAEARAGAERLRGALR